MDRASPRFRKDLLVSPTEADGVACVDVSDPKTGVSFRLYDFEYQLALQLNGQPLAEVTAWATQTFGTGVTIDGLGEFTGRLHELGFLDRSEAGSAAVAEGAPPTSEVAAIDAPTPAPEDRTDGAVAEWMSPQGAKTIQFSPDPSMLEGLAEPTPVVAGAGSPAMPRAEEPDDVPIESAATPGSDVAAPTRATEPAAGKPPAGGPDAGGSRWALELNGDLQAPTATPVARTEATRPQLGSPPVAASTQPPEGLSERRQPPPPDAVVMSGFAEDAGATRARRESRARAALVFGILFLAAIAAAVGYYAWSSTRRAAAKPAALRVRIVTPKPSAVYRWFPERGAVTDYVVSTVSFVKTGRIAELLPSGTELEAGDIIAKLQGARTIEALLAHERSRVGFYGQLRDSMRAAGDQRWLRRAEAKLAAKRRLVDEDTASLARFTIRANEPGEVLETLAKVGTVVAADAPVARVKGRVLEGAFELDRDDRAAFAKLDFCRVEVIGLGPRASNAGSRRDVTPATAADADSPEAQAAPRFLDCKPATGTSGGDQIAVELPANQGLVSGQPLRLARQRYDGVFPVPPAAVVNDSGGRAVWLSRAGLAEPRPVVVAEIADEEALVSGGLGVGDQVIIDPPAGLRAGTPVLAAVR
jgi:hypothetical protein